MSAFFSDPQSSVSFSEALFFFGNPQNSVLLVGVLSSRGKNHTRGIPLILLQLDIEDGEF